MGTSKGNKKKKSQKSVNINLKEVCDSKIYSFGLLSAFSTIPGILGSIALNSENYQLSYIFFVVTCLMIIFDLYVHFRKLKWKYTLAVSIVIGFVAVILLTRIFDSLQKNDRAPSLKEMNTSNQKDTVEKIYTYTKYLQLQQNNEGAEQQHIDNESRESEDANIRYIDKSIENFSSLLGQSTWLRTEEPKSNYSLKLINSLGLPITAKIDSPLLSKTDFAYRLDSITENLLKGSQLSSYSPNENIVFKPRTFLLGDSTSYSNAYDFLQIPKISERYRNNLNTLSTHNELSLKSTEELNLKYHLEPEVMHQKILSDLPTYEHCIKVTINPRLSLSKKIILNFSSDIKFCTTFPNTNVEYLGRSILLTTIYTTTTINVYSNKQIEFLEFEKE